MASTASIRINLLPSSRRQRGDSGRQYLIALAVIAVVAIVGNLLWNSSVAATRTATQSKLKETQARIAQLQKVIGEVDNINRRKKEVEDKLAVLDTLAKKRTGPVRLLDALTYAIPEKVWISDMEERAGTTRVVGQAESLDDVSEFMKGLRNAVWTPKGLGRALLVKRDTGATRVELLSGASGVEDFKASEVAHFFGDVDLKSSSIAVVGKTRNVKFELSLTFNYAI